MRRRPPPWEDFVLERVLFNFADGSAIDGLVDRQRGELVILLDARLHVSGKSAVDLDGETIIRLNNVTFAQRIGPSSPAEE